MRKRGSCRFEPYFKVQVYDERSMVWRDIQKTFPTHTEAHVAQVPGQQCRIMRIAENGRAPV